MDTGEWTEAEVLGLLQRTDCCLSLTASEGWGLAAFDAACLGTPVVITGFGGQVERLGADHPGLLPCRMVDAVHPDATLFEPGMRWAEADLEVAVALLRALAAGHADDLDRATRELQGRFARSAPQRSVGEMAARALAGVPT